LSPLSNENHPESLSGTGGVEVEVLLERRYQFPSAVAVHEDKMAELKIAERVATETRMLALECTERNFDEGFAIQRFLGCKRIAEDDKTVLVEALIEWYKEKPSRERAILFRDFSNQPAQKLAGISSRTMAKARNAEYKKPERKTGGRKTDSGFSMESVKRIIMGACLDGRFCEVRSWKTHAGEDSEFPFEAVAFVDGRAMWNELANFVRFGPSIITCLVFTLRERRRDACVSAARRGERILTPSS
jgi:hypothetical protein